MPIYEYQCRSCDHVLEAIQKMSDEPLRKCPECGEESLKRLISAPSFRLKGGGWYETDFKSGDRKRNLAGDSEPGGDKPGGDKPGGDKPGGAKADKPDKGDGKKKAADSGGSGSKETSSGSKESSGGQNKGSSKAA